MPKLPLSNKTIFFLLAAVISIVMPILSFDYGIVEDAQIHNDHGRLLLEYYQGTDSLAAQSPFVENGEMIHSLGASYGMEGMRGVNIFGGFFDLLSNFLYQYSGIDGVFEFRNFLNSIFGVIMLICIGLMAARIVDYRAGIVALVAGVFTPLLFGHSMNNPKDIPFAAMYVASLYQLVKMTYSFPKIKIPQALLFILTTALAINIRVSGILLICFLLLAALSWWIIIFRKSLNSSESIRTALSLSWKVLLVGFLAYIGSTALWPYAYSNPLAVPLKILTEVADLSVFNAFQLFEGNWLNAWELPWYFVPKWLVITAPLHVVAGIVLVAVPFSKKIKVPTIQINRLILFVILSAAFLPIIFVCVKGTNLYDNARHFLFIFPPLIAAISVGFICLFDLLKKRVFKVALVGFASLLVLQPAIWMFRSHPLEAMYFSPIVGGNKGAFGKYEMDYWGFSVKPAIDWLTKNAPDATPQKPARVRLWYGCQLKASYYLDKIPNLQYSTAAPNSPDWDYLIVMTAEAKYNPLLLKNWPPEGTVHQIMAGNAAVGAIVKNLYVPTPNNAQAAEQQAINQNTPDAFINASLAWYNAGDFNRCIVMCKRALALDPNNFTAWNNICAAFNSMKMYHDAEMACGEALKIAPDNQLAKNNLKVAADGKSAVAEPDISTMLNLSYNYYMQENFVHCIDECKKVLKLDPRNATACNNICSANNALGNFSEAKKFCLMALEIAPDYELAKNNLKITENELAKAKGK
ncbi:MAG: hypothetical protein KKA07_14020 [Bacteroidetes bacterium]|nr:hypothetical protein [Bacteroidota bacterium]